MSSGGASCWSQNPGFQAQRRLLENFYVSASLSVRVVVTERFLMRSAVIVMNVIALVMYNEMHCIGKVYTSVHMWTEEPFHVRHRPVDFNVTGKGKFTDMVSDSTLQL